MTQNIRPRRSVLYIPGNNQRALNKARELPADCLILDLEDAVDPREKPAAREQLADVLQQGGYGNREIVIRINALDTPWGQDDLHRLAGLGAAAMLLPKVESAAHIEAAVRQLDAAGAVDLPIWAMLETPAGILNATEIAGHPRLEVIVMGTSDLAKALRVSPLGNRAGLGYSLGAAVVAARAHDLDIIDGVHLALNDADGFRSACIQGHDLGFDGKSLIHPQQIAPANEIFGVSDSQADRAREIVTAWNNASADNAGVIVVHGQLVEQLHVDEAKRLLALYTQIAGTAQEGNEQNN